MSGHILKLFNETIGKYLEAVVKLPETIIHTLAKKAVEEAKTEIALKSIDESLFQTPEIKGAVKKLKESWKHSPEGSSDIANDVMKIVAGKAAQVQLELIAGIKIQEDSPISTRMFDQIGFITDLSILSNAIKIVGSIIPTTNAQYIGIAIDDYINSSGLSQITGFGYGMLFSNVVSPLVTYELNQKIRPNLLSPGEAVRLGYREILTQEEVKTSLAKQGFSEALQDAMYSGFQFYPSSGDFIRFAVRDTFRDDIAAKYGYDEEFPTRIIPYAAKGGLSEEWLKHYWRAHWELPSVSAGYEMLHRDKISLDEMSTLLKIGDVAPWWIPKMIDISYSPYTRVDTRRLFKDGVITREEVLRNYQDIGYDAEKAENMTDWTCKEVTAEKRVKIKDLTESAVTRAYNFGQITEAEYLENLKAFGYDEEETKAILALVDYQSYEDELAKEWKILKAYYVNGLKTEVEVRERMTMLLLNEKEQSKWVRQLEREKELVDIAAYVKEAKKKS
ncbi:hypothetical protein ES707_07551 [subsurface metagenome]